MSLENVRFAAGLTTDFLRALRRIAQIPERDIFICVWAVNGQFGRVDVHKDCYIIVTTHTIAKIQGNTLQTCRRDRIARVHLWRSGMFKWDQIIIECNDACPLVHQFGIWHRSASEYITDILSRSSPFLAFNANDTLDANSSWGCARCTLLNLRSATYCRCCLNMRPSEIPSVKVNFPGLMNDKNLGDGGSAARRAGLASALKRIETAKHIQPVLQFAPAEKVIRGRN